MQKRIDVAVVGAGGLIGAALLELLESRKFPLETLHLLDSGEAVGKRLEFGGRRVPVQELAEFDFSRVELAFFVAGHQTSAGFAETAAAAGCVVIDSSDYFHADPYVPMVVPEVNAEALAGYAARGVVTMPRAVAVQLLLVLKPLSDAAGVERVNVTTFEAVSGAGQAGVEELAAQTAALLNFRDVTPTAFSHQIAFNVVPQVGPLLDNGYSAGEMALVEALRRGLNLPQLAVNPTAVQVPVFHGHGAAVHLETRDRLPLAEALACLHGAPGIRVMEGEEGGGYPTPVTEAAGDNTVYIGRIREDISHPRGLSLWVVADDIRRGTALNSVQIAEILVKDHL